MGDTEPPPTTSRGPTPLEYFLLNHTGFALAGLLNAILIFGTLCYPRSVGLYLTLPYLIYCVVTRHELKQGQHWPWFSQHFVLLKRQRQALNIKFINFPKDATSMQYLYACHPHGVWGDYRALMDGIFCEHGVYPKTLGATVLFFIAVVREIALWTGGIDARRSVAEATLKRGESMLIVPGGEAEQIRTKYGRELVFLKKRKGFIRLAIRQGVPVIPVYAFGVADYYHTSDFLIGLRMWIMKQFQICVVLSSGMWGSPCCPILTPTTIVFGEALNFDQSDNPTAGQVDKAHAVYMEELKKLFDKHKKGLGYGDRELELV